MAASSATSTHLIEEKHDTANNSPLEMADTDNPQLSSEEIGDMSKSPIQQALPAGEWSSLEDPEDPQNWSTAKKVYHSAIPSVYCFTVTFASSVYTPGVPYVEEQFQVSTTVALLPLSLYVLGTAFGPMIAAPMSETLGRRAVYFCCLPIFGLFIIGAGFSTDIASLVICRFFAGVFGSPPLSIGAGTNADLFKPSHRGLVTSVFVLAPFLGPALGPTIGGFIAENKGWQWTQWTILFFVTASMLFSIGMKETYKKTLLERRAKLQGITLPKTGPEGADALKFLLTVTLFRPLRMLLVEPIVTFFSLYVAFNVGVVFGFFDAFPIVFAGVYHFNSGEVGLSFLGLGLGCCLGVFTFWLVDRFTYQKHYQTSLREGHGGAVLPEHRLYSAMLGSIALPISLFWFAWTAELHWISPICAAIPFGWGNVLIFCSAALYLTDVYGSLYGASAMAANGMLRYVLSSAFPLFTVQLYTALGIPWATSLFAFIAVALTLVPWVIFKWGPQIRANSHYETNQIGVSTVEEA
ncbi:hypothetical protein MMC17_000862 [Xylographa soralifera]|nr:hypothetical protein [Xylographa soralifera]